MNIILGSLNPSKQKAIELALTNLGINDYSITGYDVNSNVSSKPIDDEIMQGARNRNSNLKNVCIRNNIDYDYLVSIEGGFSHENDRYYVITCTVIENKQGEEFTGKSAVLEITSLMFEYVKSGKSLNKIIEQLDDIKDNKTKEGITGYLANNTRIYTRAVIDSVSVMGAFLPFLNRSQYGKLDEAIIKQKTK